MSTLTQDLPVLTHEEWSIRAAHHRSKLLPWVEAFRKRKEIREKHPVHDFLFEYYPCKRRLLTDWHPPLGFELEGTEARHFLKDKNYTQGINGVYLNPDSITTKERNRIDWIVGLLQSVQGRINQHHCYGIHEWAMVYKSTRIRHYDTPLRLPPTEIEKVVESQPIRCTHYDAFRFFSEPARPFNSIQPKHEDRQINEQFGCIHFNMDLFKWCYKMHPWISSELMVDCFFLAIEARELDMRASPYDLSAYGYTPIPIETPQGRMLYQSEQKKLGMQGRELASRILIECAKVIEAQTS